MTNKAGFTASFTAAEAENLAGCCGLIKDVVDFSDGGDSAQATEIPLDPDQDTEVIQEIIGYLRRHNFNPVPPKKVVSRQLEDHFAHPEDLKLAQRYYDPTRCLILRGVASYLQIPSILSICNLLTAIYIAIDVSQADAYALKLRELGILEEYTPQIEKELLQKYPFLSGHRDQRLNRAE